MTAQADSQIKEEQLVAAVGHALALIPMFGTLFPFIVWITQKDRSEYLKKQSLQAIAWQVTAVLSQILMYGCHFLFVATIFVSTSVMALKENADPSAVIAGGGLILFSFLLYMLVFLAYMVGWLVYLGFAIAGAVQSLRGADFRYPFIGRWVEYRLTANQLDLTAANGQEEDLQ